MRRNPLVAVVLSVGLSLALASGAGADSNVPEVAADQLPVAGTCAPLPSTDATIVTVGEGNWYRVSGIAEEVDATRLPAVLTERSGVPAGSGGASRHSVWIVARGDRPLRAVLGVVFASQAAGIFRVGLQVRCESGEGVMGFPLFLAPRTSPGALAAGPTGKARRLEVRIQSDAETASDPRLLYEAARRAVERFQPVVADVSLHGSVPLQDAVHALDMLWRGGVVGIRTAWRGFGDVSGVARLDPRAPRGPSVVGAPKALRLVVQGRDLGPDAGDLQVPGIRARKQAWPDEGAAQPGALSLTLEDLPGGAAADEPVAAGDAKGPKPFPNYARSPEGPPLLVRRQVEEQILGWARAVAQDLADFATRGTAPKPGRLVVRENREPAKAARLLEAVRAFGTSEKIVPSTLHTGAYLFQGSKVVGKVDLTVHLASGALGVIFATWATEPAPGDLVLPPEPVDPFAAGTAGALRVWVEGLLASAKREGAASVPLAPESEVLAQLPAVAHAAVKPRLDARAEHLENLVGWLRATTYDRVFLLPPEATYSAWSRGRVEGIVRLGLEPEESDLRINAVSAKAAPR